MLWDAIRKSNENNVNVILGANFPVDVPLNTLGMNALHFACTGSTKAIILAILAYKPNINARDYVTSLRFS